MFSINLVFKSKFGNMVSLQGNKIETIPLSEGIKKKYITSDSDKMELRDLLVKSLNLFITLHKK